MKSSITSAVMAMAVFGGNAAAAARCGRACLVGIVDQYLAAMVKHDPAGLALAAKFKYAENTATIPMGDGLWVGASEGPTTFKIYAADPTSGQVGFFGLMREFGQPVLLALRLKIENGRITEIEHVVARNVREAAMKNLQTPRAGLVTPVPPAERTSRQEMLKAADSYFDSIEHVDGGLAPFAADCERHENGVQTTTNKVPDPKADPATQQINALDCRDQMNTHNLAYITRIRPRRLLIIDEECGLVFGLPMFVHRGNVRSIKIVGVPIEANGFLLPYNASSGWE
jgi:hypothetical protein